MTAITDIYELSPMQQGMLFHTLYSPKSAVYFEQRHCVIESGLTPDTFRQAWQQVVQRHTVLRTAFYWEETEKPLQVVYATAELPWNTLDWRHLTATEQRDQLVRLLEHDRQQGFDLQKPPLMRCTLIQLTDDRYQFIWSHHHLLMDGWCNGILLQEVLTLYETLNRGMVRSLPPAPVYRDYILWLQQQDQAAAEKYWCAYLADFTEPISFGTPAPVANSAPCTTTLLLSPEFTTQLHTVSRQHRLTLNTLVQAAWAMWLHRYSGLPDVVFGVTVAGRPPQLPQVEQMLGLFINTLPLRIQMSPQRTVLTCLQHLQAQQVAHTQYEFTALSDIQRWSQVAVGMPLFESVVVFENYPISGEDLLRLAGSQLHISNAEGFTQTNYPVVLSVLTGAELQLTLSYNPARLEVKIADYILEQLQVVLEQIVHDVTQPLGNITLLTAAQQETILVASRGATQAFPTEPIHRQFEAQVAQTPDAIAVLFEHHSLTYAELNRHANQLAHYLQSLGIQPDRPVGMLLPRSLDMAIVLLAILKAGAAYVPLEPSYPAERINLLLHDTQPPILITQTPNSQLPTPNSLKVICLDRDRSIITQQPDHNPTSAVQPDHAIYILYTSGSTGTPKGVINTHRGISNRLAWMQQAFGLSSTDVVLQKTPFSFDVSVWEFFWTWLNGACLVISQPDGHRDPCYLIDVITHYQVTTIHFVPSMLSLFLDHPDVEKCTSLKRVVCSGEALSIELQNRFWAQLTAQLYNLYGPTEAAIDVSYWHCQPHSLHATVPIGFPIANTQLHILNADLQPVPTGVAGELYIGGVGLARGYWNRPDLTAERFIPNPFAHSLLPTPHSHLYKTGDRARYLPDGAIEYLGRIDDQIKLRGVRIEPGEIETTLRQHPAVTQAIALLNADTSNPQIVGYFTAEAASKFELREIQQFLRDRLPAYMVPAILMQVKAFPLTTTGKIDRRALPAPVLPERDLVQPDRPSPTIELLTVIWQQVLQQEVISIQDSFFELGGHSLLAIQIVSQIQQTFQIELPLRSLFEAPTIAQLSPLIDAARGTQSPTLIQIPPCDRQSPLPLSFAQQRLWFLAQLEPDSTAYLVPAILRLQGNLAIPTLQQSWAIVVQRHESLRTAIPMIDGQPILQVSPTVPTGIPIVDLSSVPATQQTVWVQTLIQQELQQPFSLDHPPLWRVKLLCLNESEFVLVLVLHHIITDGWSMTCLGEELASVYQALYQATQPTLPPLPIQYGDFAVWQRQWLQGDRWQQQLQYWQQHLHNAPPLLELPTDHPRPAVQTFRGQRLQFQLTPGLTRSLRILSQQHQATLYMTLLAAFNLFLYRLTQQTDLVVGTPIANRHYPGVKPLIGFFANTLALRTNLIGNPTFGQMLTQVRQTVLNAHAHQDLPFDQWVEALHPERSLSHAPIFQVLFSLEAAAKSLELPDLTWEPLPLDSGTAKFDLTLILTETTAGLSGHWEYNSDLLDASTIARWHQYWQTLLEQISTSPDQPLSAYALVPAAEQHTLLHTWNLTQRPYPEESVAALFEQQVAQTPDAIALICREQSLTYSTLNQQANQLAHYLRQLGVRAETPVGLYLERSPQAIIGILAILKAGGLYVPIDPSNPRDRVQFLLDDAQVQWVLTATVSLPEATTLLATLGRAGIDLSAVPAPWQHQPTTDLNLELHPDQLAYVMYTSGSTGQPKGVCTPHRGIVRLVKPCEFVAIAVGDRMLQAASLAFDAATWEIWATLLNGATLVIVDQTLPTLAELAKTIQSHQITTLWLTAGLFHLMVEEQIDSFSPVQQLIAGGDVISSQHVQTLLQAHPHCRVINGYGPTESTTFTCCHAIAPEDLTTPSPPIGRPIQNTQVYVLDADLQPVPIGVPGELYISGAGLARGYLNRPDLTAERFLLNPLSEGRSPLASLKTGETEVEVPLVKEDSGGSLLHTPPPHSPLPTSHFPLPTPHSLLYKTGDRVCWQPNGTLRYLGRYDDQVKVRGFRVELGEIETALLQHPEVAQAAVVLHRPTSTDPASLVAYYSPANLTSARLRQFLQTRLPTYLIPSQFIGLDPLPLTPNGKLDRQSLPAPPLHPSNPSPLHPSTPLEQQLVEIWQTVLNLETVGVTDNFFELGGDSIRAIQLVSRVNQTGWQLTPKQLFQQPTIAELIPVLTPLTPTEVEPASLTGAVPLTPIQHWFLAQDLPYPHHFNQAVWLEMGNPWQFAHLHQAVSHLLQHHDALRLRLTPTDAGWSQEILPPSDCVPLLWLDFSAVPERQQPYQIQSIAEQMQASLDLGRGDLVRVAYVDRGNCPHRLLVVIHHWAIDGVSWRILLADLQLLEQQFRQGQAPQLPAKTTSFQRWAERLHHVATQPDFIAAQDVWQTVLLQRHSEIGQHSPTPLPVDHPDGSNRFGDEETLRLSLNPEQTEILLRVVPVVYHTPILEVLLGAIAQGFQRWTGISSLWVDLESYGRDANFTEDLNLSRTVGWFTSLFPICLNLPATSDPGAIVQAMKTQLRAVPQQGIGYGIQRYLTASAANSLASPAEVSVNYLGQFDGSSAVHPGATHHPHNPRSHRLEIIGAIQSGQLHLEWHYSRQQYRATTIAPLAQDCMQALTDLIAASQTVEAPVYNPADFDLTAFDLAPLAQTQLDQILASVNFAPEKTP